MQKVNLDLIPGGVAPIAYASQYDDGRVIRFMLTSGGSDIYILSASEVITCNLTKPDGTETVIDVANPGAGKNYVDLVNGADDYDQEGVYSGEIVLTRNTKVIGSANFVLKVEEDAYGGQITTLTATGNPCTFDTDLADNLVSLMAEIVASGGGGTPSTPIPINGYTEANITANGDVITIVFGQRVYGGVLDVTRGKLHVTWGRNVYDGSSDEPWGYYNSNYDGVNIRIDDMNIDNDNPSLQLKTNIVPVNTVRGQNGTGLLIKSYASASDNHYFFLCGTGATTTEGVKTWLASNNLEVIYNLATPFDIDLTPVQISALVGTNNITSDLGGDVSVTYIKKA